MSGNRLLLITSIIIMFVACGFAAAGITFFYIRQGSSIAESPVIVVPTRVTPENEIDDTSDGGPAPSPAPNTPTPVGLIATATLPVELEPTLTARPIEPLSSPQPESNVVVTALTSTPAVDGDLSDWSLPPAAVSSYIVFQAASWDGTDDVSARWRLGWTRDALYIGVEVEDNRHVQTQTGNVTYLGDSLEIQLDTDLAGDFGPTISPDEIQLELSAGDFSSLGPEAFRFRGTNQGVYRDDPGHSIIVSAIETSFGYSLEAAIPWRDLYLTPQDGLVIGANLNINDNDAPGQALQELMKSNNPNRTYLDPTTWGRLSLAQ